MPHVFFNFQGNAVAAILGFLAFDAFEGLAALATIVLFARRKRRAARAVLVAAATVATVYGVVLLLFSLASREQVAALGEEKYFCEVDCHLAYSVAGVRESKMLGMGRARATAHGLYRVVTVRVRFDPETTSVHRPNDMALTPNPRFVRVVEGCVTYLPDAA
jgi:hypothetical protein